MKLTESDLMYNKNGNKHYILKIYWETVHISFSRVYYMVETIWTEVFTRVYMICDDQQRDNICKLQLLTL